MLFFKDLTDKRVAVGFFGMHFKESYKHWMGWKTNVDWRRTNYRETIARTLSENGNQIDYYLSTYHTDHEGELLEQLKPKKWLMNDFDEKDCCVTARHNRFKETLRLFDNDYDYYMMTRFDLNFSPEHLLLCRVEDDSINVTSKHGMGDDKELICDFFYIFSNAKLAEFRNFIENIPPDRCNIDYYHRLHRYDNAPKFSFMLEGSYYSHECPLWRVLR